MNVNTLSEMVGAVIRSIEGEKGADRMVFHADDGRAFTFYHPQDCCESVSIEDVCGDVADLLGSPVVLAEEVSNIDEPAPSHDGYAPDSYTWTFYRFGTAKGTVTVRWLGESNGYYGEGVDFYVEKASEKGSEER